MEILRDTDANAKLVGKTIASQLYPLLTHIKARIANGGVESLTAKEREQIMVR
jgi:hypothetical protein